MRRIALIDHGHRGRTALVVGLGVTMTALVGIDSPAATGMVRALVVAALTWATIAARPVRLRAPAELLFGLIGVIAGAGIGPQHASQSIGSVQSIAGIASLLSGLVLVALAGLDLVRQLHGWLRLSAIPVALVALLGIVMPMALAVFVTNAPDFALGPATPSDHDLDYSAVTVTTDDGVDLAAWYIPSTNGAAVVLLGGAAGARHDELDHAAVLADNGYGVLMLDVRGHGGSEGDAMLWGWWGEVDVRAGVDFLSTRAEVRPARIGAVGMSMGGEEAIAAAGADPRITAVVAEGASGRGVRGEGQDTDGWGGLLVRYFDWTTRHAAEVMTAATAPTSLSDAVRGMSGRKLLVIAAGTQQAEIDAAAAMERAAPDVVDTWIARGADHTQAFDSDPGEWERRAIQFLDSALSANPATKP